MRKKSFTVLLAILLACGNLLAQSFDYGFKHLTTDHGLSHDNVHSITKDNRGLMWFGTMNGLSRFDGMQFKVFKHKVNDSTSLPHNYILSIASQGLYIYAAHSLGVARFDPATEKFTPVHFPDANPTYTVSQIAKTTDGRIYITYNNNLYLLDPHKNAARFICQLSTTSEGARVFAGPNNNVWVVVRTGVYLFDTKTNVLKFIQGVNNDHSVPPGILFPYTDPEGNSWGGSWDAGLMKFNDSTQRFEPFASVPFVVSIAADPNFKENHLMWVCGGYSGLVLIDVKTKRTIDLPKNINQPWSHNGGRVHNFYADTTNGILWLGTEFGLEKYDPNTEHFARKMMPSSGVIGQFPSVNGVIQDMTDPTGHTWWVSAWVGGFWKWNRNTDELTNYSDKLHSAEIFDVEQDDDGNIWIAEWRGIQIFNPRTNQWRLIDSFIKNDTVSTKVLQLFKDSRGNMWFAQNFDGVFKYDKKQNKIIRMNFNAVLDTPQRIYISTLSEDKDGKIWGVSSYHSFCFLPDGTVKRFRLRSNPGNVMRDGGGQSVTVDKNNNTLWIAQGENLFNVSQEGDVIKVYNQENGIIGVSLRWLATDPEGFIWLATENSMHRLNPATGHFRYYKKEDGLFSNNITEPMTMSKKGDFFIGFHNAFSYTNIYKLNRKPVAVPFIITSVRVEDRWVNPVDANHITLDPNENTLNIEFAALDYSEPQKIQYAYWLEGMDRQWHFTSQRDVSFTNLSGGRYVLHLKVMGPNGIISKEELTLGVTVIPHFYETWWFWLVVAMGVAVLLYSYYYMRRSQKKRLENIRERIATDLHDDMGSTLSSIRIFSDVMRKQLDGTQPQLTPMLEKISNNASELSDNMQDIIWTIKQDHDKLEDLVTRMREFGLKLCDAKDIMFKVHISDSFKTSKLNLEQRRNLYLIFKECLNNAIKYADCKTIQLFITQQGRHLKMVIEDNGRGFSAEKVRKGNGLKNIGKRAQEINGAAKIESAEGRGTRVDVLVKLV